MAIKINATKSLNSWLDHYQKDDDLDFSPESLNTAEKMILDRFDVKEELLEKKNREFVIGVVLYIGEVFKRYDKIRNLSWTSVPDSMPVLTSKYYANSSVDIFQKFPSLLYSKNGDILNTFFEKNISYFKKKSEKLKRDNVEIPGTGGMNYKYYIYNDKCTITLNEIKDFLKPSLTKRGSTKDIYFHDPSHLLIDMNTGYFLHLEGEEIDNPKIDTKKVIAFWGDEDPEGDYLNEHLFILEELQEQANLFVFDLSQDALLE